MHTTIADLRLALRGFRRNPLFATVAVLSLALGIGANTAIFTLLDQIVLRKLPVRAPHELVMLYQDAAIFGSNVGTRANSYPLYQDFQKRAEPLAEVICRHLTEASVSIDNSTERVQAEMVSGNYFSTFRSSPAAISRGWTQSRNRPSPSSTADSPSIIFPAAARSANEWDSAPVRDRS